MQMITKRLDLKSDIFKYKLPLKKGIYRISNFTMPDQVLPSFLPSRALLKNRIAPKKVSIAVHGNFTSEEFDFNLFKVPT
ncbi:CLUMA_CG016974, isoform A [Clunio marinus]|uniref:CLUMA_CG016974, isoform A n=1 Tax=Clunio marinus TaxID=568069 RepID=A0A1J1IS03_9DIPT|nr:CLUMA_CG016974, isoform A [Clunio marinus]